MNPSPETSPAIFKRCNCCLHLWPLRGDLLADPQVEIIGYQADFESLGHGLFLFNHLLCGTTMAIQTQTMIDLYHGPIHQGQLANTPQCAGLCLKRENLQACPAACACAHFREIIQIIKHWPKILPDPAAL